MCGVMGLCGVIISSASKKSQGVNGDRESKEFYWTNLFIVLNLFKSRNKKLSVFVAHKVGEIQELTVVEDWNHVATKENPVDLVSRSSTARELCGS